MPKAARYLVEVSVAEQGSPQRFKKWLVAISYQDYEHRDTYRALTRNQDEAFVFTEPVAAEFAAAFIGGKVVKV